VSVHTVTDLINSLPDNSSVNTVQHATIEEAVSSVDPTDAPIDWHMFTVGSCTFGVYIRVTEFVQGSYE
jgi:hypothetical protein